MNLERGQMSFKIVGFDEVELIQFDGAGQQKPCRRIGFCAEDLRWLCTVAGPALLAQLDSEMPRESSKGPLREATDGN